MHTVVMSCCAVTAFFLGSLSRRTQPALLVPDDEAKFHTVDVPQNDNVQGVDAEAKFHTEDAPQNDNVQRVDKPQKGVDLLEPVPVGWKEDVGKAQGVLRSRRSTSEFFSEQIVTLDDPRQNGTLTHPRYHGTRLGFDVNGNELWRKKPLGKPLKDWWKYELAHAHHYHGFNAIVSDSISLNRAPVDFRNASCPDATAYGSLKPASVIVTFNNEAYSTLLRMLHSILNTSPPALLGEIILVDDGSDRIAHPMLFGPLEKYIEESLPKVRLVRHTTRYGLMQGRMRGANLALYENLIFFDSHVECGIAWLEPLLARLEADYRNVAVPSIESIDANDFSRAAWGLDLLGLNWEFESRYTHIASRLPISTIDPVADPIMAGGLFAITARWFNQLGQYDRGLRYWGTEEIELSLKTWQCGGRLELIPCSRVAHVFRSFDHAKPPYYAVGNSLVVNKWRVAAVWLDDIHQKILQLAVPPSGILSEDQLGDLTDARRIRKELRCHNFSWFLENVFPEFPMPDMTNASYGALRLRQKFTHAGECLDTMGKTETAIRLGTYPCHGQHGSQAFILSSDGQLRLGAQHDFAMCATMQVYPAPGLVVVDKCVKNGDTTSIPWKYEEDSGLMTQGDYCLGASVRGSLEAIPCTTESKRIQWEWVM